MNIPALIARKQLSRLWLIGLIPMFLVVMFQTITNRFGIQVGWAWAWTLIGMAPLGVFVYLYSSSHWRNRETLVREGSAKQVKYLSIAYLLLANLILIIVSPYLWISPSHIPIIKTLQYSLGGLVPLQALILTLMILMFFKPETIESPKKKILFLGANPKDTARLRIDEEVRDIDQGLRMSRDRDSFELKQQWAVTAATLQQAMLDEVPQFVHFSGHGSQNGGTDLPTDRGLTWDHPEAGGLALEDEDGNVSLVSADALSTLFHLFEGEVSCVVLNACYSKSQAEAIVNHVPYVIGMQQAVPDDTAIAFAVGFYRALGAGKEIEFAFEAAKNAVALAGLPGSNIPVLLKQAQAIEGI